MNRRQGMKGVRPDVTIADRYGYPEERVRVEIPFDLDIELDCSSTNRAVA